MGVTTLTGRPMTGGLLPFSRLAHDYSLPILPFLAPPLRPTPPSPPRTPSTNTPFLPQAIHPHPLHAPDRQEV